MWEVIILSEQAQITGDSQSEETRGLESMEDRRVYLEWNYELGLDRLSLSDSRTPKLIFEALTLSWAHESFKPHETPWGSIIIILIG